MHGDKIVFNFRYFFIWECRLSLLIILTYPFISLHELPCGNISCGAYQVEIQLYQYHIAAIGILFTWLVTMIHISENPLLGGYVQMLVKVSFNFLKFFIVCISLLIAFGCSFSILFPRESSMSNMISSPLKGCLNSHISHYNITIITCMGKSMDWQMLILLLFFESLILRDRGSPFW